MRQNLETYKITSPGGTYYMKNVQETAVELAGLLAAVHYVGHSVSGDERVATIQQGHRITRIVRV